MPTVYKTIEFLKICWFVFSTFTGVMVLWYFVATIALHQAKKDKTQYVYTAMCPYVFGVELGLQITNFVAHPNKQSAFLEMKEDADKIAGVFPDYRLFFCKNSYQFYRSITKTPENQKGEAVVFVGYIKEVQS